MTLRGWRLFGVAGTIFAYLAGILLLSFMSLSGPPQRHPQYRNGRYDFESLRHHEVNLVAKRQPLQWCQPLRFFGTDAGAAKRPQQAFPGHFIKSRRSQHKRNQHNRAQQQQQQQTATTRSRTLAGHTNALDNGIGGNAVDDVDAAAQQHPPPSYAGSSLIIRALLPPPPTPSSSQRRQPQHRRRQSPHDAAVAAVASGRRDGKSATSLPTPASAHAAASSATASTSAAADASQLSAGDDIAGGGGPLTAATGGPIKQQPPPPPQLSTRGRNQKANHKEIKQLSDSTERNLIALASFPGSGNTWLRYLLQQATGIYTGSVYKDFGLLKSGFPAENVFNSSVLVVKTHEWGAKSYEHFSKAILLVRDPDRAILAEFNRQSGGHVGFAAPDRYKRTKGRYWQQFVANKIATWEEMNTHWARNYTGDLHIVYYDDLVADVEGSLRKILNFIRFPINEDQLACAVARKEGIYRRKKRIMTFDPFTPEMHIVLEQRKRHVYTALGRNRF